MTQNKKLILLDIDDVLFDTAHFKASSLTDYRLYEDVLDVLDDLGLISEIGILSQGEHSFQLQKLLETGIHDRFSKKHVHIVEKKDESLTDILAQYKDSDAVMYFVDDRLNGLYYAKQALPKLTTIWLHRGRYVNSQDPIPGFKPDKIIDQFRDIISFIRESQSQRVTESEI